MNNDAQHLTSFEDQFTVPEHLPVTLVGLPEPAYVAEVDPFTPTETTAAAAEAAKASAIDHTHTESLVADLDKATESLTMFRTEITRLVELQRETEAELREARGRLIEAETHAHRIEGELTQERRVVSTMRTRLGELIASLDSR
jgi:hypothetical protein